jgi:hypothetical protein
MRKIKRFGTGDVVGEGMGDSNEGMKEAYDQRIADETAAEEKASAMKAAAEREGANVSEGERVSSAPATPRKSKVVTKEQLEKSGLTLREYLNKEQGLTARGGSSRASTPATTKDYADEATRGSTAGKKPQIMKPAMYDGDEAWQKYYDDVRASKGEPPRAAPKDNQSRILTGMKKKPDENKLMGSIKYAKGGSVSSASSRADGCAIRGKTRA